MTGISIPTVRRRKRKRSKIGVCITGALGGLNPVEFCGGSDSESLVNWLP